MFAKLVVVFLVIAAVVLGIQYQSNSETTGVEIRAANWSENAAVLALGAATFAVTHPTTARVVAMSELALPQGFVAQPGLTPIVSNGNAYLYYAPGGQATPLEAERDMGGPGRRVGVKAGALAKDVTGAVIAGQFIPLPAAIPDGSAVYVAREALPPPPAGPASPTAAQPPPLAPVSAPSTNPPPVTWPGSPSVPVVYLPPTTPPAPVPPAAPAQPPINPPSAPTITSFTFGIYGQYEPTQGPKQGQTVCAGPVFNTFVIWDASQGNPADTYTFTVSRAGTTATTSVPHSNILCANDLCGTPGTLLTDAQAIGFTPDVDWTKLLYDHAVVSGQAIAIYPWVMDITVTLKACNAAGCGSTTETTRDFWVESLAKRDCDGTPLPPTAHP